MKISSLPFYRRLSPSGRNLLSQSLTAFSAEKGQILHESTDGSYGMIYVEEGTVTVSLCKGITLQRLYKGDVCFLTASETFPELTFDLTVISETNARILSLADEHLALLMKRDSEFARYAYDSVMKSYADTVRLLESILTDSVERRLALFLLNEMHMTGEETLSLTHEQIAHHIGSAREVVTRVLKKLSAEGIVTLGRGTLTVVGRDKLRKKAK